MKKLVVRWIIMVVAMVIAATIVGLIPGTRFRVDLTPTGVLSLFLGTAVLALVNATLGKLIKILTLPLTCLTLGLFSLVINAALFWAVGTLGLGFTVGGPLDAFLGSILVSACAAVLGVFVSDEKKDE
ncbi:MAG: phage holin family protein [Armatimonadetes bacterium]|nr:phage holin family protein [Armatimonadota bacterium]